MRQLSGGTSYCCVEAGCIVPSGLAAPYSGLKFFNLTAGILRALTPRAGSASDPTKPRATADVLGTCSKRRD